MASLTGLVIPDDVEIRLVDIARQHCKLALEYGKAGTTVGRRIELKGQIQSLRSEREDIVASLNCS